MKNIQFIIVGLLLILSFSSCQKGIDGNTAPADSIINNNPLFQIKTYTEEVTSSISGHSVTTFNLNYDASGRIISLISASNPGDNFLYHYNTNNTFTMDINNANQLSIHETFYLNNLSLIDSTLQYTGTDTTTEKYVYNAAKQLVVVKEYDYSPSFGPLLSNTHNYTYDNNGNNITDADLNGTITYDYYPNLLNNLYLLPIYFVQNKNLVKTTTYKGGGISVSLEHTYTFDSSNRLSTDTGTENNGDIIIKTYTY